MKTLICTSPGNFSYADSELPVLKKNTAIIKIKNIGICGTDLHAFEGTQPFFSYPRILGHELSGELMEVDNANGFTTGEAVTFLPYFNCGYCIACRNGKPNCCVNIQVFGVHIDGGMSEYITVPSDKLLHGEGLSFEELALVEPLAIGAHAINKAALQKDEWIVIIGAGPIGLATMEFAKIAGGNIIVIDVNDKRLSFCKQTMNIPFKINAAKENAVDKVKEITSGNGATVVVDATGNLTAINNGIYYLAHGGRYILVGLQKENFCFSHPEFHKRETTLMSSRNALRSDFETVIKSIKNKLIKPEKYITHKVGFDEVSERFPGWLKPEQGVIKAMVTVS